MTFAAIGGFDVVAGKSGSGNLAGLPRNRLESLRDEIAELSTHYDRVILDLGAGLDLPVRLLSAMAGLNLVVTTDEPTSMTDAYAYMKLATAKDPKIDIRLVINQAKNQQEGRRTYDKLNRACASFLKISPRLAGIVRTDGGGFCGTRTAVSDSVESSFQKPGKRLTG